LFVQNGLQKDEHQAEEVEPELLKDDGDTSDVIGSSEHLHLSRMQDAVDQCDISLVSSTSITAAETGNLMNHGADSSDDVILTAEVNGDATEADRIDPAQRHSTLTPVSSSLDVVESTPDGEPFTADGMPQSEEFDKSFITNDDMLGTLEYGDEAYADGTVRMAAVQSTEAYSVDTARQRPVDSVDTAEWQRIAEVTGKTASDALPASAAGDSAVSSAVEYIDTLHSLVSELKTAISSAQSGITALCPDASWQPGARFMKYLTIILP